MFLPALGLGRVHLYYQFYSTALYYCCLMSKIAFALLLALCLASASAEELEMKYFIFTPQCYEELVDNFNLAHTDCIKYTFSKLLGYGMVAGGAIVKIPQLLKILFDRSVFGISYESVVFEAITNWITIVYNWFKGNPFSIYGENVFIGIQNLLIMAAFILYVRRVPKNVADPGPSAPIKYLVYFCVFSLFIVVTKDPFSWPPILIDSSMILQITFFSLARLSQIYKTYKNKSTGSLSLITALLLVLGNLGRLFTILVQIGDDYLFAASVFLAFVLNSTIALQFFIYWNSDKEKAKGDKEKAKGDKEKAKKQ